MPSAWPAPSCPDSAPAARTAEAHTTSIKSGAPGLSITSSPASGDSYAAGETISVREGFDKCVRSASNAALTIWLDGGTVTASVSSTYPTQNVVFSHTVTSSDYDFDGISVATNALAGTYNVSVQGGCTDGSVQHGHAAADMTFPNVLSAPQASHKVRASGADVHTIVDYDTDDDRLIEVSTPATA